MLNNQISLDDEDKRDVLIDEAYAEFNNTGECLNGTVTRAEIIADMEEQAGLILEAIIEKRLSHKMITETIQEYEETVDHAIKQAVDDMLFDMDLESSLINDGDY